MADTAVMEADKKFWLSVIEANGDKPAKKAQ